ncbi:helix-turn-helix domain-containing protein [Microbacterium sp. XT11]|uniref:helix-turn-helix domain-containing protein n=1 Tax=Microbacterium sp. XT11 TaxID=367477 RepID=UPI0007431297|nr:helix-turn-helix domain-containing protein [Microbacterium sp. XT11]ALX67195.1 AraC-family transcriptional regulator [Microbacterium sp. XT11]
MSRTLPLPDPSIEASSAPATMNRREPCLLWVHSGAARVVIGAETHMLATGQGLWVPPGVRYRVTTETDSVAFPIFVGAAPGTPRLEKPVRVEFPAAWTDWLIHQFARSLGYLRGMGADGSLMELVTRAPADASCHTVAPPPLPISAAAAGVAQRLLQTPADDTKLTVLAAEANVSIRTLQHQFASETGLSFNHWRTAMRIAAARAYLEDGFRPAQAAAKSGFETAAGFTKAFRAAVGVTPNQYRRSAAKAGRALAAGTRSAGAARISIPESPPPIPATRTWERTSDFHVLVWVCRGSAKVSAGGRIRRLREGEAAWLPAGVPNEVELEAGTLLLPLGSRPAFPPLVVPWPAVRRFPPEAERRLLHSVVANYTTLRPRGHDPHAITRFYLRHAPAADTSADPYAAAIDRIQRGLIDDPADRRGIREWALALDVDAGELGLRMQRESGSTFAQWRAQIRSTIARRYLEDGLTVQQAAAKLGYAHPSGFTKAFARAHELAPREYQRRGWRRSTEPLIDS